MAYAYGQTQIYSQTVRSWLGSRFSEWLQHWPGQALCGLFKVDRWCDLQMFPWISLERPRPLRCENRPASWGHPCLLPLAPLGVRAGHRKRRKRPGQPPQPVSQSKPFAKSRLNPGDFEYHSTTTVLHQGFLCVKLWCNFLLPKWPLPGWSYFLACFQ